MPQWELIAEDDEIVGVICPDCPHAARAAGQTGRAGEADPALEAGAAASVPHTIKEDNAPLVIGRPRDHDA